MVLRVKGEALITISIPPPPLQRPLPTPPSHTTEGNPLLVHLLIRHLLRLLLLRSQEVAQPGQGVRGDDQTGRHHGLARLDQAVPIDVPILIPVRLEDVVLAIGCDPDGEEDGIKDGALDLVGGRLDDGELLFDLAEAAIGDGVGLVDVRRHVLVRPGEIGKEGLGKGAVPLVGQVERDLTDGVGLEAVDRVVHDGVGSQMLSALLARRLLQESSSWRTDERPGLTERKADEALSPLTVGEDMSSFSAWGIYRSG